MTSQSHCSTGCEKQTETFKLSGTSRDRQGFSVFISAAEFLLAVFMRWVFLISALHFQPADPVTLVHVVIGQIWSPEQRWSAWLRRRGKEGIYVPQNRFAAQWGCKTISVLRQLLHGLIHQPKNFPHASPPLIPCSITQSFTSGS